MLKNYSIATKTTALIALCCLLFGITTGTLLSVRMQALADKALSTQANALIEPLADAVRIPLFAGDNISLQVLLEKSVNNPQIVRASFYDVQNHLKAQGLRSLLPPEEDMLQLTRSIEIDKSLAGRIVIEIDRAAIVGPYNAPVYLFGFMWLVFSVVVIGGIYHLTSQLRDRLNILAAKLPNQDSQTKDELDQLEEAIAPLLAPSGKAVKTKAQQHKRIAIVALELTNLEKLSTLLNHDNYHTTLQRIDSIVATAIQFYQGKRLRGDGKQLFFTLAADDLSEDYVQMSLMAASAIKQLLSDTQLMEGIGLHVALALELGELPMQDNFSLEAGLSQLQNRVSGLLDSNDESLVLGNRIATQETELTGTTLGQNRSGDIVLEQLSTTQQHLLRKQCSIIKQKLA